MNPSEQRDGRFCCLPRQLEWVLFDKKPDVYSSSQLRGYSVNERLVHADGVCGQPAGFGAKLFPAGRGEQGVGVRAGRS